MCQFCKAPAGLTLQGKPRKVCDDPVCREKSLARARVIRTAGYRARRSKVCPVCGDRKPLNKDNWYPSLRAEDGTVLRWDGYCIPCRRADMKDRYATTETRRVAAQDRARRQREQIRAQRGSDPEFDEAMRERQRGYAHAKKEGEPEPTRHPGGEYVWAAPLAALVREHAQKMPLAVRHNSDNRGRLACERAGVAPRQVWGWESDPNSTCLLDVADRVLVGLGESWWLVYDPERFPGLYSPLRWIDVVDAAAAAFEGERLLAA